MSAKPTLKDGPAPSTVVPSTGTHVVARLTLRGGEWETDGYVPQYGEGAEVVVTQDRARRMSEANALALAKMHDDVAKRKGNVRFEAREFEDLFGGEA